jgi:hypothetical protein
MPRYTDDELFEAIKDVAERVGHPPTLKEFREFGEYSVTLYYNRFGSWQDALVKAGYEPRSPQEKLAEEELRDELRRLASELGHVPTVEEMNAEGEYWASTYRNRFGSWADAVEAAGFDSEKTGSAISPGTLLEELRRLGDELGKRPTVREMDEKGEFGSRTYVRTFQSWNHALEEAGFDLDEELTREDLIRDLRHLKQELGKRPTLREMNEKGPHSHTTYVKEFGSWSGALEAAFES